MSVLTFCMIILATPIVVLILAAYIMFIKNIVDKNSEDATEAEKTCLTATLVGSPIVFWIFWIVMKAMIRDYGWTVIYIPLSIFAVFVFTTLLFGAAAYYIEKNDIKENEKENKIND